MAAKQEFLTVRYGVAGLTMQAAVSARPLPTSCPAVVLVHGLALSGRYMMPTAALMPRRYRVFVPDLPGFGDSGKPRRILSVPQLADSLAEWMQVAGLRRAHLLGNSFGCQIIVDLAARHPELVDRVVLQGPTTTPSERGWFMQWLRWRQNSPYNPPEMAEVARRDYDKCGRIRAVLTFRQSLLDRIEDKLPRVRAPALVVRGQCDPICREHWAEAAAQALPNGRLVLIPAVAHTLVFTSPQELASVAVAFFEEATAADRRRRRAC